MQKVKVIFLTIICFLFVFSGYQGSPKVEITDLKCESAFNPIGIDLSHPGFSWLTKCRERGKLQSACQIIVADSRENFDNDKGTLWDSGKFFSSRPGQASYKGKPLASNQTYYWKVRIWDEKGEATPFSDPARFTTSILDPLLWQASWIGAVQAKIR